MIMRKTRSKRDKVQRPVLFFLIVFARLLLTIFETFFLPLEEKSTHIGIAQLIQINSVFFFLSLFLLHFQLLALYMHAENHHGASFTTTTVTTVTVRWDSTTCSYALSEDHCRKCLKRRLVLDGMWRICFFFSSD